MFNNDHFITKGVLTTIPVYLQNMIWYMIAAMETSEKDSLQVFELKAETKDGKRMQRIIHRQERPPYEHEIVYAAKNTVTQQVYVVDYKTYSTMLLSSEDR